MKKNRICIMILLAMLSLTGCETSFSYTFDVSTGEQIKVTLDTSKEHKLKQEDGKFSVEKDDIPITQGGFLTEDEVNEYFEKLPVTEGVSIIEQATYEGNEYVFYFYNNTWYHIVRIEDAKTGIALINSISEDSAKECFELLQIQLVE